MCIPLRGALGLPAWAPWACAGAVATVAVGWGRALRTDTADQLKQAYMASLRPLPLLLPPPLPSSVPPAAAEAGVRRGDEDGDGGHPPSPFPPASPPPTPLAPRQASLASPPSPTPTPPGLFVVLAHQRTGTNLLCGLLHGHPEVRAWQNGRAEAD